MPVTGRNDLAVYDRTGSWWDPSDPVFAPLRSLVPARLAYLDQVVDGWEGVEVLDLGCGGGLMTIPLCRRGATLTGVDRSAGALAAARSRSEGPTWVEASADALPFPDASFDRVVCTDLLVHVPDPAAVMGEIGRVLRPGGLLHVSTIHRTWLAKLVMVTLGEDLLGLVHRGTHDPAKFTPRGALKRWAADAGLDLERLEGVGPVGWVHGSGLHFGRWPTLQVMVQGHAWRRSGAGELAVEP